MGYIVYKRLRDRIGKQRMRQLAILLCLFVMGLSIFQIWRIQTIYAQEERIRVQMEQYKPVRVVLPAIDGRPQTPQVVNQQVLKAQELNPDIVGWLTLEGTSIDSPFVKAEDNDKYLRRDINGKYSYAGTLFMDSRSNDRFTSFSSVIYGHNMRNGTMFSDIGKFDNASFFNEHPQGWLYLADATYELEVFAYMLIQSDDSMIYKSGVSDDVEGQAVLNYIAQNALRYRDLALTPSDRLVVLSTCTNYENQQRRVLLARLVQVGSSMR